MQTPGSSIAAKLTRVNMTVSGVALVLAAIALGAYDRATFRQGAVRGLSSQAQIVAAGTVSLRSDVQELNARRTQYVGMIAVVLAASMIAALAVSLLTRNTISRPIAGLAAIARTISQERDYSVRAPTTDSADEIAVL